MAHKVDPGVLSALWDRVKSSLTAPVRMFVMHGIKADKGERKQTTEYKVWMGLIEAAYTEGVKHGYVMACDVFDVPDPATEDEPVVIEATNDEVAAIVDELANPPTKAG